MTSLRNDGQRHVPIHPLAPPRDASSQRERDQHPFRRHRTPPPDDAPSPTRPEVPPDEQPRVQRAHAQVCDIRVHQARVAPSEPARKSDGGEDEPDRRAGHPAALRAQVGGRARGSEERLEHAVERHCRNIVDIRAEDDGRRGLLVSRWEEYGRGEGEVGRSEGREEEEKVGEEEEETEEDAGGVVDGVLGFGFTFVRRGREGFGEE